MSGDVRQLQRQLMALGHLGPGNATGNFGDLTRAAIRSFKLTNSMIPNNGDDTPELREGLETIFNGIQPGSVDATGIHKAKVIRGIQTKLVSHLFLENDGYIARRFCPQTSRALSAYLQEAYPAVDSTPRINPDNYKRVHFPTDHAKSLLDGNQVIERGTDGSLSPFGGWNLNQPCYNYLHGGGGGINPFEQPQCTWFVWGRIYELTGLRVRFNITSDRNGGRWTDIVKHLGDAEQPEDDRRRVFLGSKPQIPTGVCIVSWKPKGAVITGHVGLVEGTINRRGKTWVTLTESNLPIGGGPRQLEMTVERMAARQGIGGPIEYLQLPPAVFSSRP